MLTMKKTLLYLFITIVTIVPLSAENYSYAFDNVNACYSNVLCQNRLALGAEWLYWKAEQSQMEVAYDVTLDVIGGVFINLSTIIPDFKYSNGYRVYADYLLNDCWSIGAAFTHLPSHPSVSVSNDPASLASNFVTFNSELFTLFGAFTDSEIFLSNFDVKWDLNLYYLDAYIRRTFCLCRCIAIDPYVGARGFWMKQDIRMDGTAPAATGGPLSVTATFSEKFCGAGLLAGINACWQLPCGFSFIGKFGSSLIYSDVHNDFNILGEQPGDPSRVLNKNKYKKSHPSIDSFIGLQYLITFCRFSAEAHIGWENHLFFHTNQFTVSTDGNLSLQGLTLGGTLIF